MVRVFCDACIATDCALLLLYSPWNYTLTKLTFCILTTKKLTKLINFWWTKNFTCFCSLQINYVQPQLSNKIFLKSKKNYFELSPILMMPNKSSKCSGGAVVKWLRLHLSIERSDVRGPPWSVLVAWGWGNITQPRKITKKIAVVLKQGHNSGSPWRAVCWSYHSWINYLKKKWAGARIQRWKMDLIAIVRINATGTIRRNF